MIRAIVVPETLLARWRDMLTCLCDMLPADGVRILRHDGRQDIPILQAGDAPDSLYAPDEPAPATPLLAQFPPSDPCLSLPILWPDSTPFGALQAATRHADGFSGRHDALMRQMRAAIEDQLALLTLDRIDSASVSAARHDSERALRESEQRFRLLVENALDDFFMHDDKGRFLDVNARACRNLGYTREELLTMSASDLSKDLTQAQKEQLYRTTEPGASAIVHAHHIRKDGTTFPVEVLISCHLIQGRKLFLGMVRDISDRVDARKALEQLNAELEARVVERTRELNASYESLRQAERLARIGSWTLDLDTGLFSSSDMLYEMNGMTPGSPITPADLRNMMPPDDFNRISAAIERCVLTGEPYGVDISHLRRDGSHFSAHVRGQAIRDGDGRIVALTGTVQDFSEREAARAQLAAIADSLPNGAIYRIDHLSPDIGLASDAIGNADIRLSYISAGIEPMIGVPADALMQDPSLLVRAIHDDDRERYLQTSRESTQSLSLFDCKFRLVRPDGSMAWLQVRSAPRQSGKGWVWDGIILDVTREHEISEALRQAKETAEKAERAKADFLATMSHEIRTPMNSVIGMTRLALQTPLSPQQRNYLEKIDLSARALLGIINDILDFSRIEAGGLVLEDTEFALDAMLESVSNATALRAGEKGLEVVYAVAPGVPRQLRGDPLRLSQVLINLVGNAIKFTHHGEIVVSVDLAASPADAPSQLQFSIQDTGIGMDAAQIANLFQPFSQADPRISRQYGGTGLGLSICKRLVGLMGGSIRVDSLPGRGSCFRFTIALRQPASQPRPMSHIFQGKRVLIVDDMASARQTLSDMTALFGIACASVASGWAALDALHDAAANGLPFDLVLMDWQMPEMDGIETARRIRADQALPYVPAVLMVTAYGRDEILRRLDNMAFQGLLIKPVTESMLFNAMQHAFLAVPDDATPYGHMLHDAAPQAPRTTASYPQALQGRRVLLVDDNVFNLEVASDFLALAGMQVTTAASGQEALALLARERYDVVLMDLHMPHMDGLEATRRIRAMPGLQALPVIALTAQARVEDRDATQEIGMTAHLTKPIDEHLMYATLARVLQDSPAAAPAGQPRETPASAHAAHTAHIVPASLPDSALAPSGTAPAAVIDLAQALQRMRGDPARLYRLLDGFSRDFGHGAAQVQAALSAGDIQAIADVAHKVKGAAGYLSAHALTRLADSLERAARDGDHASMHRHGPSFGAQLQAVLQAIALVRPGGEAPSHDGQPAPATDRRPAPGLSGATAANTTAHASPETLLALTRQIGPLLQAGDYAAVAMLEDLSAHAPYPMLRRLARDALDQFEDMDIPAATQTLAAMTDLLQRTAP